MIQAEDGLISVEELREGHMVHGVDYDGNEAMCRVVMKVYEGRSNVFGNYTADHLMLLPERDIAPNGVCSPVRTEVPVYNVMTSNCIAITDATGQQPTAFTSRSCGLAMNFSDIATASRSAVELHRSFGDIVFDQESWTGEDHSERHVPLCIRMVRCADNITGCDVMEGAFSHFPASLLDGNTTEPINGIPQGDHATDPIQDLGAKDDGQASFSHQCSKPAWTTGAVALIMTMAVIV